MKILLVKPKPRLRTILKLHPLIMLEPLELGYVAAAVPALPAYAQNDKMTPIAIPAQPDAIEIGTPRLPGAAAPETFVIGKSGAILYHGSIDDSQNAANVKTPGLRLALDAVLSGQSIARAETKAFGCAIKRVRRAS